MALIVAAVTVTLVAASAVAKAKYDAARQNHEEMLPGPFALREIDSATRK
jgi:hypothetical protein